jgi:hypothetical protein
VCARQNIWTTLEARWAQSWWAGWQLLSGTCPNRKSEEKPLLLRFGSDTSFGGASSWHGGKKVQYFPQSMVWPQDPQTPSDQGRAAAQFATCFNSTRLGMTATSPPELAATAVARAKGIKHRWLCECNQMMAMACQNGESFAASHVRSRGLWRRGGVGSVTGGKEKE